MFTEENAQGKVDLLAPYATIWICSIPQSTLLKAYSPLMEDGRSCRRWGLVGRCKVIGGVLCKDIVTLVPSPTSSRLPLNQAVPCPRSLHSM